MLDVSARLDFKTNQLELLFSYQNSNDNKTHNINLKPEIAGYKIGIDKEATKEFISFLYECIADMPTKTSWDKERGVSAVVDTNPSRE